MKRTYIFNIITLSLLLLTYLLLLNQNESLFIYSLVLILIFLGIINSVLGFVYSFRDHKRKKLSTIGLVLSVLFHAIFPLFLVIVITANSNDMAQLFQ